MSENDTAAADVSGLVAQPCTCHPDDNPPSPCAEKYALSACLAASTLQTLSASNAALEAENARLREALAFYADIGKYPAPVTGRYGELYYDCGAIARAADVSGLVDPDMPAQQLRMHLGEMTAQEMRTARAAIRLANSSLSANNAALEAENAGVPLDFRGGDELPDIKRGQMKACIILMRSRHNGRTFTIPAYYLNGYPLEMYDGCGDEKCEDEHEDGCPTTGWYHDNSNFEYENCYYPIEGECLAWALLPDADTVSATLSAPKGGQDHG